MIAIHINSQINANVVNLPFFLIGICYIRVKENKITRLDIGQRRRSIHADRISDSWTMQILVPRMPWQIHAVEPPVM